MEGYLFKYVNFLYGSRKRYFRLQGDVLLYYKSQSSTNPKDSYYLPQCDINISQKEPLKIYIKDSNKSMEMKTPNIQEKVKWFNALIVAKKSQQKLKSARQSPTPAVRHRASLFTPTLMSPLFDEPTSPFQKKKEKPSMDDKFDQIWKHHASMDDILSTLIVYSRKTGLKEIIDLADKLKSANGSLKKAVTEVILDVDNYAQKNSSPPKKQLEFPSNGNSHPQSARVEMQDFSPEPRKPRFTIAAPNGFVKKNEKEPLEVLREGAQNSFTESSQESFQSFEDQIFYNAQESYTEPHPQLKKPEIIWKDCREQVKEYEGRISKHQKEEEKIPDTRDRLPVFKDPKFKFSIWSIIKDAIGKDLSKLTVPVFCNEPLSMLQKVAEALEYEHLLVQASKQQNSLVRMAYVAIFNIVQYCCQYDRLMKPFNPILGETYELIDVQGKFRYFAEQVSHHPPISACHADSPFYQFYMNTAMKSSFGMQGVDFRPLGSTYVNLILPNGEREMYHAGRPNTAVHNIIMGKMWAEQVGNVNVVNRSTNEKCKIKFQRAGWSKKNLNKIQATIYNADGLEVFQLDGRWHNSIVLTDLQTGQENQIWTSFPLIQNWAEQYHFTKFGLQLNYLTPKIQRKLPPTDARFRPDQRALEQGDLKLAAAEKHRLQEKQRAARKKREKEKQQWKAFYFQEQKDELTKEKYYQFTGKYWEDREKQEWDHLPDLFSKNK